MINFEFKGKQVSALGLGCMRLPVKNGNYSDIDIEKASEMVAYCLENGVNYFDTAWGYHNGMSEPVMGEILSKYPRESYYLASKFPGYEVENISKVQEIFEAQLKRCKTEYFDFYLFHNVNESDIDIYLDRSYGLYEYLKKQKEAGRIKHIGFSTHGTLETVKRFMQEYGDIIEFCQIQLNWMDYDYQNARAKVDYFNSLNIPLWIMEPLRGGALVTLDKGYTDKLEKTASRTLVEWAFRYIQSIDGVGVTLSGMSNFEQLKENIEIFSKSQVLTRDEVNTLYGIADEIGKSGILPCTACKYCIKNCPVQIDIPSLIKYYNTRDPLRAWDAIAQDKISALPDDKKPSACLECGACEAVCPQNISIREMMKDFSKRNKL